MFYPFVDRYLGCFHVLAIVNNAAVNIRAPLSFQISVFIFSRCIPRNGVDGSHGTSIFSVLKKYHTVSIVASPIYIPTNYVRGFSGRISYSKIRNEQQCPIFRGLHRVEMSTGCLKTAGPVIMILMRNTHKDVMDINILLRSTCYMLLYLCSFCWSTIEHPLNLRREQASPAVEKFSLAGMWGTCRY